ncbi:uncharacterized protein [Apostichopus japonicus]|uniref:uncharacterized protein isoform X2 n=1 Tax=Stichopus japonicus TaxID=307972 RepID=UPI003AB3ECFD
MAPLAVLVTIILLLSTSTCATERGCKSPQYLEIGKSATIVCHFEDTFSSIFWYYKADVELDQPTVTYEDGQREGDGYLSGEFDIRSDGSLIVNNVSVEHETTFIVIEFETVDKLPNRYDINIKTIILPNPTYPIVDDCTVIGDVCYVEWLQQRSIICRIQHARPSVALTWVVRTVGGDKSVTNETTYSSLANAWISSLSVDDPFIHSSYLALLVCKANDQYNLLDQTESLVLVHNKDDDSPVSTTVDLPVERHTRIELPCPDGEYKLLVWEKIEPNGNASSTSLAFDINSAGTTSILSNEFELNGGKLSIRDVQLRHGGVYRCTYSDDQTERINLVNLIVFVTPVPEYPIIDRCTHKGYCVLDVNYEGTLSCTVKGISPEVNLEWKAYFEESQKLISFHNQQLNTKSNGETSDVTLTTEYSVKDPVVKRITLECKAIGPNANLFSLSSKLDLLLKGNNQSTTEKAATEETSNQPSIATTIVIIVIIVLIIIIIIAIAAVCFWKAYLRRNRIRKDLSSKSVNGENIPMLQDKELDKFISQLKSTYENFYSAVKPIPFFSSNCTVHELYVEGGIDYLAKSKPTTETWNPLDSYKNMFSHPSMTGTRWMIEGGPGYGKSTLSLQLAYEWCNNIEGSSMCDVEFFFLIRLRQLKGVSSIYEAIKKFILPIDSTFSTVDIQRFITNSSSVLIILDGFDEYPDREVPSNSDVFNIIKRTMFPEHRVVLTTRSSHLPEDYAPQTNRIRLTGFNSKAQEEYLQKAVTINGYKSAESTIQEWLQENPILNDLCVVPLFFVMYAHLSLDSDALRNCTSVTSFFRYMITCLHSHLKLKFKDENVDCFDLNENAHQKLDELCFSYLNGHSYNPDIDKHELIQKLGERNVEKYLKIGILREEESTEVSEKPSIQASDHVKNVSKVRFYHSLFCEWYASHHVADELEKISNSPAQGNMDEILEDLDPSHLQYVYRFACGIKAEAAKRILNYLQIAEGNFKFSILCILEQGGNIDAIIDNVRHVCSETLQIRTQDSRIVQRSVIQLAEIAVSKKILISKLQLIECFQQVDPTKKEIILDSKVRLPLLNGIKSLWIEQTGKRFSQDEMVDIFNHISECEHLSEIRISYALLPYSFKDDRLLEPLRANRMQVLWYPSEQWFILDLHSGNWQHKTGLFYLAEDDYKKVVDVFQDINN